MSSYKLVCPHCNSRMRIRTSEGRHVFLRVAYLQCINEACGWSVRAQFEMTHELSPSGMPNPDVHLPSAYGELRRAARNPGRAGKPSRESAETPGTV
ncbi:ogr/Delta-like zinc finger family protein [Pseudomonas guariconensis]|uniref:ogr/Delta-like zinc finger family protein n=1 Tax=Pseudomonas TaxID=286 RepID=UPI001CE45887|nr:MULTISPECIES: ogr/Delta-like zinc finger family protein [Pseudomonas]MCO7638689.1 ogr/Delta-like zinc finger family protein [Pseudomonas sp. S 311-6]MCO7516933.1 ogr/Delta-like zinc finger family protein [Pseudomonas putida]MCO7564410.1 ogr/Delta-like zinc finger family protein [Pseudomonas mosselii]MCO7595354.1 ogr/Delta-like zinc finger family protein [Pseudomonas guariconensis]MCO7604141.1 ogr/Delta-like zinc finger family protein [Pseudomonas guariconensis]